MAGTFRTRMILAFLAGCAGCAVLAGAANLVRAEAPATSPAGAPAKPPVEGLIQLDAKAAQIHGQGARFMVLQGIGNICYWQNPQDWVSWELAAPAPGRYVVEMKYSCQASAQGSTFDITLGDQKLSCRIDHDTGTWYDHEIMKLGTLALAQTGGGVLALKPTHKPGEAVMNLAWIRLVPEDRYADYVARTARERAPRKTDLAAGVYLVPNFHPASCGWLTDFSTERNYCAYSYLAHLDRVRDDPTYAFALSEVNNILAIMAFEPSRIDELKQRVREGRVGLANAFFLEPTINLSGGEALVKMGVEGLRWQEQVMGFRPRLVWGIDVTGVHEQMAQIVSGLGLDGMVYTRDNPTGSALHWLESPDGTRALAISPGHYSEWGSLFNTTAALSDAQVRELVGDARAKARRTPAGCPVLVLGGGGDYALPPARKEYPAEFFPQWKQAAPDVKLLVTTPGKYLDAILSVLKAGEVELPVARGGARLSWTAFWIETPPVKIGYRHAEHSLQSAEAAAAVASLRCDFAYPVQDLYHGWLLMLLNMDRNTLWGAAGGMVYEDPRSWDVHDRLAWVEGTSARTSQAAVRALLGPGKCLGLFNPLNWERSDVVRLTLPPGTRIAGTPCQADADGTTLCRLNLPSMAAAGVELEAAAPQSPRTVPLPGAIENAFYTAKIDPRTGALVSLTLKPSGREVLAGPVQLVAESGGDWHNTPPRPQRKKLADSSRFQSEVTVSDGPLATTVQARSDFHGGGRCARSVRFYKDSPRIDFDTELNDIPNATVVVQEFPLADKIQETRRGIPYGFSHGAWAVPNEQLAGYADGIQAAIRWSHYQFVGGGGVAILDRGLPGRELNGQTPVIFLLNAFDQYMGFPCAWLSGKGAHRFSYAMVAHDGDWKGARIPPLAWEFNSPPLCVEGVAKAAPASFLQTSDNVIVEALRREGADIELRLAECLGFAGTAEVKIALPHTKAALTDLTGARPQALSGGPAYRFPVRAQQIVTMRFATAEAAAAIQPLLKWDPLVPPGKLEWLHRRLPNRKGLPPSGPGDQAGVPVLPPDAARSLTLGKKAVASNVFQNNPASAAEMAVDGDGATRWATDGNVAKATLDVDLAQPATFSRAWLAEGYDRVRAFELQYQDDGGQWKTFARGGKIGGTGLELKFEPVTARKVRLNITDAPGGPTIWEFMLFAPNSK